MQIPVVSLNDDGRVVVVSDEDGGKLEKEPVNKEKRKLKLSSIPFSLTSVLHKNYILADPTAEEESVMETILTVVLDSSFQLVSLYKPGGPVLAQTSVIQVRCTFLCELCVLSCHVCYEASASVPNMFVSPNSSSKIRKETLKLHRFRVILNLIYTFYTTMKELGVSMVVYLKDAFLSYVGWHAV